MRNLKSFRESTRGNVAMIFGLSLIPLLVAGGVVVDYGRQSSAESALQQAVDAAALSASNGKTPSNAQLKAAAINFLMANGGEDLIPSLPDITAERISKDVVRVSATGEIDATIMKLAGFSKLSIHASAEITRSFGRLEFAMVLDNTASMSGTKLNDLKSAAKDLVDVLFDPSLPADTIKAAVIPFSQYVNVGKSRRGADWLNVPADSSTTRNECWDTYPNATKSNCRMVTSTNLVDGVPVSSTNEVCDWNYGQPVKQCSLVTRNVTWEGCVGSRNNPLDVRDEDRSVRYPGVMLDTYLWDVQCPSEIQPLTSNKGQIVSKLNQLVAVGDTYMPGGLMWGWNALSPAEPLAEAESFDELKKGLKKAVVLMTDGLNSQKPVYPKHSTDGNDPSTANGLTAQLCANMKDAGIILYTVAFQVESVTTKNMLETCASGSEYYFDASNATLLSQSFQEIGKSLANLHISK